jgi:DNA polymerase-3 subunit alpha
LLLTHVNVSHATSYGLLTYASAYLKHYYPREYLTNLLTNAYERAQKDVIGEILDDCRRYGIKFLPLDVNKSNWEFTLEGDNIRIGMCAIKSFGEKAAAEVLEKRPFTSLDDVLDRVVGKSFNKKIVNVAIFSGLFDEFVDDGDRLALYKAYMEIRGEEPAEEISTGGKEKFGVNGNLTDFEEALLGGQYLSDPANDLKPFGWEGIKEKSLFEVEAYVRNIKKHKDSKGNQMAFLTLATGDGNIECTVFSSSYTEHKKQLKKNSFCVIRARKDGVGSCILQAVA